MEIKTTFNQPTNTSGASITAKATIDGHRRQKTVSYPYHLNQVEAHKKVVEELLNKNQHNFNTIELLDEPSDKGYTFKA